MPFTTNQRSTGKSLCVRHRLVIGSIVYVGHSKVLVLRLADFIQLFSVIKRRQVCKPTFLLTGLCSKFVSLLTQLCLIAKVTSAPTLLLQRNKFVTNASILQIFSVDVFLDCIHFRTDLWLNLLGWLNGFNVERITLCGIERNRFGFSSNLVACFKFGSRFLRLHLFRFSDDAVSLCFALGKKSRCDLHSVCIYASHALHNNALHRLRSLSVETKSCCNVVGKLSCSPRRRSHVAQTTSSPASYQLRLRLLCHSLFSLWDNHFTIGSLDLATFFWSHALRTCHVKEQLHICKVKPTSVHA